jgi:hypothetical protein
MSDSQDPELVSQARLSKPLVPFGMGEGNQEKRPRVRFKKPKVRTGCKTWCVPFPGALFLSFVS